MPIPSDAGWRLFLAIWPDASVRAALQAHQASWHWPPEARRTRPEKLHLTLHFIGDVPAERVAGVQRALRVPSEPFELEFLRATVWPGSGGVAVLEPAHVPAGLTRLHAALAGALQDLQLRVETRPYRPHVTIARRAAGAQPPVGAPPIRWAADGRYLLMRTAAGGAYQTVQDFG